jgi:hypothetical protein
MNEGEIESAGSWAESHVRSQLRLESSLLLELGGEAVKPFPNLV